MAFNPKYSEDLPTLAQVEALTGDAILEFGTPWCTVCQATKPIIQEVLTEHDALVHIKVFDGKGKRLGRSFQVKLWPTLIALHNGKEVARLVRPTSAADVRKLINELP